MQKTLIDQHKQPSHGIHQMPWLTFLITVLLIGFYYCGSRIFNFLQFQKQLIGSGEYWRFVSGHFVHCNFEHLFWDTIAFIFLGCVIELHHRRTLLPALLVSCLTVSSWLFWGQSERMIYCGLSGALNGLLIVAVMMMWERTRNFIYFVVVLATITKIIVEYMTHQTIFTSLGPQAIPGAHAAGIIGGILVVGYMEIKTKLIRDWIVSSSARIK